MEFKPVEPEEISSLSLDDIYQRLSHLDLLEQSIAPPPQAKTDSEDSSETSNTSENEKNDNNEKDPVIEALHCERSTLRNQAMVLSRPSMRPLTIFDLPDDLLRNILDQFSHPAVKQGRIFLRGRKYDLFGETRKTIQNVRLVCRVFNELASPLLCPLLQVNLDQESLDRAVHLSYSPRVACGIRAIRVGLQCFPGGLASDLARFKDFRKLRLQKVADSCDWHLEGLWFASQDSNDEEVVDDKEGVDDKAGAEEAARVYREAINSWYNIVSSWDDYVDTADGTTPVDDVYQEILRKGHEDFCQKHRQQRQQLESQLFVRTLASCMVRMPNATTLGFSDEDIVFTEYDHDPDILLDNRLLSQLMTTALSWREIEDTENLRLATARVLSELPIAIHNAGITLHALHVDIFPCKRDHILVSPDPHDPMLWGNLRTACQSLRRASFGNHLNCLPIRETHLGPNERLYIDEYLSALLCSPGLEMVDMHMHAFGLNDGRGSKGEYDLSPVLAAAKWPSIRNLSLLCGSLNQSALDRLCAGLGSSIKNLHISSFELFEGSWAGALDLLREKVVPQGRVYFSSNGGEFGPRTTRDSDYDIFSDFKWPETPPIYKEVEKYISGVDMDNPLQSQSLHPHPSMGEPTQRY